MLHYSANLTDEQKIIAEYGANGPRTELPPGTGTFASYVSAGDNHNRDTDVKMFFAESNAILDAGITVWGMKRIYTSVRPITAIHYLFAGKAVRA